MLPADLMLAACLRQAHVDADAQFDIAASVLQSITNIIAARLSFLLQPTQKLDMYMRTCQSLIMHPSAAGCDQLHLNVRSAVSGGSTNFRQKHTLPTSQPLPLQSLSGVSNRSPMGCKNVVQCSFERIFGTRQPPN